MSNGSDGAKSEPKGWLESALGLFADVRGKEGPTVLLLALNIFLILTAYYVIKPVREALILAMDGGAEVKSYSAAGQSLLLLLVVPAYSLLASRLSRRRLINVVNAFFIGCLVLFYFLAQLEVPLGIVFYLWVGIFSLMVIAQFWSFANDVYTPDQGKRLFAIVGFGMSAGAVLGSRIAGVLIVPLGVYQLMLVAAGILALSLVLTNLVAGRESAAAAGADKSEDDQPIGAGGAWRAFQLVVGNRYLLLIAFLIMFLNWVNTTGEYILGRAVKEAAETAVANGTAGGLELGDYIGKFYADFQLVTSVLGLLIQLFLVSRILKYLGIRVALFILPVIAFGGYALLIAMPILSVVRWAKTAENATDYSLQNTLRAALFLKTTREQKYMAKQAIDTIFVRVGDVLSAVVVFVGTTWLTFETRHFAAINLAFVVIWLGLAYLVGRENASLTSAAESASVGAA